MKASRDYDVSPGNNFETAYTATPTKRKTQAEKEAAYIEAYKAYKRGERKCPSRWEFGVRRSFAEAFKSKWTE